MDIRAAIAENYGWLRGQVYRRVKPPLDIDDVLHTVIEHMLVSDIDVKGHFRPWAAVIARNVIISLVRKAFVRHDVGENAKMSILPEHAAVSAPQDKMMEVSEYLEKVLALPPREFDVFLVTSFLGYGPTRVAEVMGLPIGSVKSIDSRCRQVLAVRTADDIGPDIAGIWKRCKPENGTRNARVFRLMMTNGRKGVAK